jgi:hypothetical protein
MIIKRWTGSAFVAEYPKTIVDNVYTGDGVTQVFDPTTDKIKAAYLPDVAFGDMRIVQGFDPTNVATDSLAELLALANTFVSTNGGTARGCYFVASATGTLATDASNAFQANGAAEVNAGDWVLLQTLGTPNYWSVINNTYGIATASALGLVQIGYTENAKNYPVELASNKMYVYVPWVNTTYALANDAAIGLVGLIT